ncbi:MAG: hypothetical protein F6K00_34925 [Leptolyngbya sp. SIOISBB]|nr:hypothetical protein [Leptolyngbya sp. SIOISBB]
MQPIDQRIQQILDHIEAYQAVALEDYGVPAWQALPPASAPHLAFRPNCGQLTHTQDETGHFWYWEGEGVYWKPHWEDLQVSGVCVSGSHAIDVPKVPTDELWEKFETAIDTPRAVVAEPAVEEQPSQPPEMTATTVQPAAVGNGYSSLLLWIGLALAAGISLALWLLSSRNKKAFLVPHSAQKKASSHQPATPSENEYDFTL